jgi:putative ABC transport system permease protein
MFSFLFIFFYVFTEKNYDKFLPDSKRLFHMELSIKKNGASMLYSSTPPPLAETIFKEVPGIDNWCTYCTIFETCVLNNGEKDFLNPTVLYTNPGFLKMFNYQAINGTLQNAIDLPGTVVVTKSAAIKYLGTTDIIGKRIKLLHDKKEPLLVTVKAVIDDMPYNSNVRFELVCTLNDYFHLVGDWVNTWYIKAGQSYITLNNTANVSQVQSQINTVVDKYMNIAQNNTQGIATVNLDNISKKHFSKDYILQNPTETFVSKSSLNILFIVGLITLLISWLNYINFLNYQNANHSKETEIRKIVGSGKRKLFLSSFIDSFLLTLIPISLTVILFLTVSPSLYRFFSFPIDNIRINFPYFWLLTLGIFLLGTILSAILPTIRLVNFRPVNILQNKSVFSPNSGRNMFVILSVQFILSILLICGIIGINLQMRFLNEQSLGFTKENILVLSPPVTSNASNYIQKMDLFKKEMAQISGFVSVTASSSIPGQKLITEHFGLKNKEETINKYLGLSTDGDYFNVIDVKFLAGENFNKLPEMRKNEIIINKTLLYRLGFSDPKEAILQKTNRGDAVIIGVVDDYHHTSLHDNFKPIVFYYSLDRLIYLSIKFRNTITQQQIASLKSKWNNIFSDSPFEYSFLDTEFANQYKEEKQLYKVVMVFSLLSVLIMVLGLIGSCLNNAYKRTKEIGIRKVNGAKISEILGLLNKDFIKWAIIAYLIALPLAWYLTNKWLDSFAYRIKLYWWVFALAGLITLLIALFTISIQSWKVATKNPVEALRYE